MILVIHPYSHPDPAIRAARVAAASSYVAGLRAAGQKAIATCPLTHGIGPTEWEPWWPLNAALLDLADEVHALMLDGWEHSQGMAREITAAREAGKPVHMTRSADRKNRPNSISDAEIQPGKVKVRTFHGYGYIADIERTEHEEA